MENRTGGRLAGLAKIAVSDPSVISPPGAAVRRTRLCLNSVLRSETGRETAAKRAGVEPPVRGKLSPLLARGGMVMRAMVCEAFGGPEVLVLRERPDPPPPGPDEVQVRITARGVQYVDV